MDYIKVEEGWPADMGRQILLEPKTGAVEEQVPEVQMLQIYTVAEHLDAAAGQVLESQEVT